MKIVITEEAFTWFQEEIEVEQGDYIRFYARYGGSSPFHEGFSLGMNRERPHEIGIETDVNGVRFYIEKNDEWFFNEHDLYVSLNEPLDELVYEYKLATNS
ncbi:HesB/YadR/YfhF family protein [Lysinibacillus sp. LZ02]|uniref:HesB/YadR/YfhF family protein n=1 Tax=Lysinibacillus sp. LZ02 TaxID=3420668 RepID=UPI003D366AEA